MAAKPKATKKTATKPLSVRHERFCVGIVSGMSASEAYVKAGYRGTKADARCKASRLATKANIKSRIVELGGEHTKKGLMTRDEKREIAASIARNETAPVVDRLRACAEDAKLAGHYEPEKHQVETGPKTLDAIRERAKKMVRPMSRAPKAHS
jgi:phage terminase small subunit